MREVVVDNRPGYGIEYHNLIAHTHKHTRIASKKGPLECIGRCRRILARRLKTGYMPVFGDGLVLGIESWGGGALLRREPHSGRRVLERMPGGVRVPVRGGQGRVV